MRPWGWIVAGVALLVWLRSSSSASGVGAYDPGATALAPFDINSLPPRMIVSVFGEPGKILTLPRAPGRYTGGF
jgi:hypothetical protein